MKTNEIRCVDPLTNPKREKGRETFMPEERVILLSLSLTFFSPLHPLREVMEFRSIGSRFFLNFLLAHHKPS
jgi:hypothetical protein